MNTKKTSSILGSIAAFLGFGLAPHPGQAQTAQPSAQLEEVIVTAQKRDERLQDVPIPVTAISAGTLTENNQLRIQDYYSSVPGLIVSPNLQSTQTLAIRGITTGAYTSPTVGVTVDDVPYGTSVGDQVPDIDPSDLVRIEVLRGPQGTLYGASSMGGLLKFVTVDPSTEALSGRVEGALSSVHNGAELGYNFRGSVNVPVSDTLAFRASGFTRQDPGYIDNPVLHIDGINKARVSGGRLAALWRPSDELSVKFSALYQESKSDGSSDIDQSLPGYGLPPLGDLQQSYVRGVGGYDRKVEAYSVIVKDKLGSIDLTSVTGYNINSFKDSFDYTWALGSTVQSGVPGTGFNGFGVGGAPLINESKTSKFTQEVRLSSTIGQHLDWLVGGFYTHEDTPFSQTILAADPVTGVVAGQFLYTAFPTTYAEYAGFADLTYHFTDRFDVQVGARASNISQTYNSIYVGPYDPAFLGVPSPVTVPEERSSGKPVTYLLTPRFKISPDLMVYARLASGYRAGGPNQVGAGIPPQFDPDKTKDYELGAKGTFLNHTLSFDASVYYIDWNAIQLALTNAAGQGYTANAGSAKSEGVELSVESRPANGLTLAGWIVWNEAVLTENFPASAVPGAAGDRLPYTSRFSGNLSLNDEFPLSNALTGFVGASASYVGDRLDNFAPPPRQDLPAYTKIDGRAGLKFDSWSANLFVTNATDKRGLLGGGAGNFIPYAYQYIQPRTVGLSVAKTF